MLVLPEEIENISLLRHSIYSFLRIIFTESTFYWFQNCSNFLPSGGAGHNEHGHTSHLVNCTLISINMWLQNKIFFIQSNNSHLKTERKSENNNKIFVGKCLWCKFLLPKTISMFPPSPFLHSYCNLVLSRA